MRTIYRCYDGDASMVEAFDSLEEARAFMQRRGLRYFDWAWCDDDQVREYYIPDDEDEEDYKDDDGAYLPSITPVLVDGENEEEEDEEVEFEESIYVDAKEDGKIRLDFVRERVDDYGDSTGEGLYVYVHDDNNREYYEVTRDDGEYVVDYVGDVDPDIERVIDLLTDNIYVNSEREREILEEYNDDPENTIWAYCKVCEVVDGVDDDFIAAVKDGVEEWFDYRDDCFVRDNVTGKWRWRGED